MGNDIRDIISGKFNKIIEVLHEGYILVDEDGNIIDANPAYCKMIGYTKEELVEMDLHQVRPGMSLDYQKEFIQKVKAKGSVEFETQHQTKSGDLIDLKASAGAIEADGKLYLAGLIRDITNKKETERKIKESTSRFESLFNHNPNPVYYFDLEGNFKGCNDKLLEFTGYTREEILELGFAHFVVEEDLERTWEHFQKAASGTPGEYEISVQVKEGIKKVRITKFPIYQDNEITGVFGILQDITERKQAKARLEESEQRFKSLFEHNPNAVYSFGLDGNFLMANGQLEVLVGYSLDELKEMNFEPLTKEEDREMVWSHFKKAAEGKAQRYEARGIHKQGHEVYFYVTNLPIYVNGEIVGVFGIAQDITDQKKLQDQLKKSEKRWQHLLEGNPQPVQVTIDGEIVFINQAGAELYGATSPEDITGISVFTFSHPGYEDKIEERKYKLENNLEVDTSHEHKIKRLDGQSRNVVVHSIPTEYQGEKAIQTVLIDITDRIKQERIIKNSLKEKEVLLKEIHHRVKNNMAVVSGLLQLQAMNSKDPELTEMLQESQLRIYSMAMIHEKLYQTESLSDISLGTYIMELVETIRDTVGKNNKEIEIKYDLTNLSLDITKAIPCALILNELVVNSFKHAFTETDKGTITVSLHKENNRVKMTVKDNGEGLPDDFNINKLQTLGMTLIQTLAGQLAGEIGIAKDSQKTGTEFFVKFPLK